MDEQLYEYCWGNNSKRKAMKGRLCRVLARGKKNSCAIEFLDNGQREIVSKYAIRKAGMKKHCKQLLDEHAKLRGPGTSKGLAEMNAYIAKAQTCLLFTYAECLANQDRQIINNQL